MPILKTLQISLFLVIFLLASPIFRANSMEKKQSEAVEQTGSKKTETREQSSPFTTVVFSTRTQYRTASKGFYEQLMFKGVVKDPESIFKDMFWSIETDIDLGKNMDQWKSGYQEAEFNKPFALGNSDFWLEPGFVFHWESAGSRIDPYLGLGYAFDPTLKGVLRYRYNHQNHDSQTLQGDWDDSSEHRLDIYLMKQVTPDFSIQYNPTYLRKTHGDKFEFTNGKNHTLQHVLTFNFRTTPRSTPFFELGYLDKYQTDHGMKNEYLIRVGFRYSLN